ncbi:MAG: hypothetical protein GY746_10435, partial [Gammaproteobacteria bacterium]|nr:hypothetical protein [Gammaproteobacteria bacterium]
TTTANITPAALILSGITADNKVYNADVDATVVTGSAVYSGLLASDVVSVSTTGVFSDKNVADSKTVTLSSSYSGADTGNYSITDQATTSANITPASLSISSTDVTKTYDGTDSAVGTAIVTAGTLFTGDVISGGNFTFADVNVNTNKTVNVSAVAISDGNSGSNYSVTYIANAASTITPYTVDLNGTRVYDGTTDALASDLVIGTLAGTETLTLSGTGNLSDAYVEDMKAVALGTLALGDGTGLASNYTFTGGSYTLSVTPYVVDLSGSRVYDGTTGAAASDLVIDALVGIETLTLSGTGFMADEHVGVTKTVTLGTLALGDDTGLASNYTFTGGTYTQSVTPYVVDLSGTRVYDTTTDVQAVDLVIGTLVGTETLNLVGTGSMDDKNSGLAKVVNLDTLTMINGTGLASNYTLDGGSQVIDITRQDISVVGILAVDKVYDGNVIATIDTSLSTLNGALAGDDVSLDEIQGEFVDKNVGTDKTISGTGFLLLGADADNYSFIQPVGLTADITPKTLLVSASGIDKVYDGLTDATVNLSDNRVTGDQLTFSYSANYIHKNVSVGKYISISIATSGVDAGNYIANTSASAFSNITVKNLLVSGLNADDKVYDGTTSAMIDATAAVYTGLVAGDDLSVAATGLFDDKNAGTGKVVNLSSSYSGADTGNYSITDQATTTANITKATLTTAGAVADNRIYDATTDATITGASLVSILSSDDVTIATSTGSFVDKDVADGKSVTAALTLGGTDAGNYMLTQPAGLTANITKATLTTAGAVADNRIYDATTDATITGASLVSILS